jgi:lactobin A/cerein 7B family class IIb bacteriocin
MNLENLNLVELNAQEVQEVEGGFLPAVVIGICWGVMAVSSAVALGMKHKYNV